MSMNRAFGCQNLRGSQLTHSSQIYTISMIHIAHYTANHFQRLATKLYNALNPPKVSQYPRSDRCNGRNIDFGTRASSLTIAGLLSPSHELSHDRTTSYITSNSEYTSRSRSVGPECHSRSQSPLIPYSEI